MSPAERYATVCDKCLKASCWHWIFPCDDAFGAGLTRKPVTELIALGREHADYLSVEHIEKYTGENEAAQRKP